MIVLLYKFFIFKLFNFWFWEVRNNCFKFSMVFFDNLYFLRLDDKFWGMYFFFNFKISRIRIFIIIIRSNIVVFFIIF